jgi:hypothetical protein
MSVDDRLRAGLRLEPPPSVDDLQLIPTLEVRAGHRRLRRRVAVAAAATACVAGVALALPFALRDDRSSPPPVTPASTTPSFAQWSPPDRTTPVDGRSWGTGGLTPQDRLAALAGTGLAQHGQRVLSRVGRAEEVTSQLRLWQGAFTGFFQSHNRGTLTYLPHGTFEVDQDRLVITFTETSGRAVFRWQRADRRQLSLELVSTTAPDMFGAPAEVALRMWSVEPFTKVHDF